MSLEQFKKGINLSGDCGSDPTVVPEWMDREKFKRGQQFFVRHMSSATFALHCAVTSGFGMTRIIEPLAFTKRSDTPPKALLRYMKTFVHASLWHLQDVWDETTLGHKSVQTVRRIHNKVREDIEAKDDSRKYITQYDMALVQVGFFGLFVMYPSHFGINCTKEEISDYIFFWRGIGYLMGIQDEFNVAALEYDDVYSICKEVEKMAYSGLVERPPDFEVLSNAYVKGANLVTTTKPFTREAIIQFSLGASGLESPNWLQCSWLDYFHITGYRFYTFLLRSLPGFESLLNWVHMTQLQKRMYLIDKEIAKFM